MIRGLERLDADLGWAIVRLFEKGLTSRATSRRRPDPDSELVNVANGSSLIVVNRGVFKKLPGIDLIPLHGDRAFLALSPDAGVAGIELAVVDRLADPSVGERERAALIELRAQVRRWRRDPALRCKTRSIIVVERRRARKA